MALVTGYAVYFNGGRSHPAAGDGVSGGSLVLDFDPEFAEHISRGIVNFPELEKREGGFFALEGATYFVPDNPSGLPIEYEGRVILVACDIDTATQRSDAVELEKTETSSPPAPPIKPDLPVRLDGKARFASKLEQEKRNQELRAAPLFDEPDGTDYLVEAAKRAEKRKFEDAAPDRDLSASLKSIFDPPELEDVQETKQEPEENQPLPQTPPAQVVPIDPVGKAAEIEAYFSPVKVEDEPAAAPIFGGPSEDDEEDDWAVYLAPQPTVASPPAKLPAPQVVQVIAKETAEATAPPNSKRNSPQGPVPFDPAIDLVLAGPEKETFSILAEQVVETVESFDSLKKIEKEAEEEPLLVAELSKLDPNAPDLHPRKLLPWIKRNETEEEMLDRLTIKSERYAG